MFHILFIPPLLCFTNFSYGPRRQETNQQSLLRDGFELEVLPPSSSTGSGSLMSSGGSLGGGGGAGQQEQFLSPKNSNAAEERMTAPVDKSMYPRFNDNAWMTPSNMLRRPSSNLQRERNGGNSAGRSKLRHVSRISFLTVVVVVVVVDSFVFG